MITIGLEGIGNMEVKSHIGHVLMDIMYNNNVQERQFQDGE